MRTRVKICGITSVHDAGMVVAAGADAIGLVFYPPSPRAIDAARATEIVAALPAFVTPVALFVNPQPAEVERVLARCRIGLLQFHGDEPVPLCRAFGVPYLKALRVRPEIDLLQLLAQYDDAAGWLLDAHHDTLYGGTGKAFDWNLVPRNAARPIVLSGGLTPENVSDAVHLVHPWAVDVASGVESAKGIKDPAKVARFIAGVRNADR